MTTVYALFAVYPNRKELVAVFSTNQKANEFAAVCDIKSWHIQEVPFS